MIIVNVLNATIKDMRLFFGLRAQPRDCREKRAKRLNLFIRWLQANKINTKILFITKSTPSSFFKRIKQTKLTLNHNL